MGQGRRRVLTTEVGAAALGMGQAGVTTKTPINGHGLMAGGTLKKDNPGNKAISHLDFDAIDAAFGDASAACA